MSDKTAAAGAGGGSSIGRMLANAVVFMGLAGIILETLHQVAPILLK